MVNPALTTEVRASIIVLAEEGYSQRAIAERLCVSKTAVQETIARKTTTGSIVPKKRPGRPRKTTKRTDQMMRRIVTSQPSASSSFVQAQLPPHVQVSTATIRRRLCNDFKLRSYRPAIKPRLSKKNIRDRLKFCQQHLNWTVDDWPHVMFSDETLIRQFNPTNVSIRRPTNERYNIRYIGPSLGLCYDVGRHHGARWCWHSPDAEPCHHYCRTLPCNHQGEGATMVGNSTLHDFHA